MKMSKHYRGHRYHRGRRCHGGDLGIIGLIIFFVILFAILLASIGGHQQRSSSSNGTNSTLSQRSSRKVMLNQYSRDDKTPYMQDDMNDYHQPFHEKADFDDQFAAMEAQVHSVSSKED